MEQKYVTPVLMWVIILLGAVVFFWLVPTGAVLSERTYSWLLFFPALAYGLYFYIRGLSANHSPAVSAANVKQLATTGAYAVVRHPIYSADIVIAWGVFFAFPSLRLLVTVIWATAIFVYWAKLEEEALVQKFGEEYQSYRSRVPMLFPDFWKKLFGEK
ncbi:MAG: isoprenylcysteine carboxylmethyltransferase family protein [Patescibacteria group bacterium]|nr:isoprenylcysteine carboxylmethyltransferase family protein [Patescibacteria group bacterium]